MQFSGAGVYGYEYAVVCTVIHRLVAALWLSRHGGALCQSTMLPSVIMQGELNMAEWQGGIPVEDSSRAMVSVLDIG